MSESPAKRIAVVLFNLGGPDGPDSVRPFLFNLFKDKAILRLPWPARMALAGLISTLRASSAKENYAKMGGGSPLLPETQKQAEALEAALAKTFAGRGIEAKCFIAMRYWKPLTGETAKAVKAWGADEVIALPLYPQFSTTTTASSWEAWTDAYRGASKLVCCYPDGSAFAEAHAAKILQAWREAGEPENVRLLLSAHGLPQKVVDDGDPYQWQVEQTAAQVRPLLPAEWEVEVCYQSRVGPLKWIEPATETAIERAAEDGKTIIVTPIAFVSEHIETLVELDEEYRELAEMMGAPAYIRAPALGVEPRFIETLRDAVVGAVDREAQIAPAPGARLCPKAWGQCPAPCAASLSSAAPERALEAAE